VVTLLLLFKYGKEETKLIKIFNHVLMLLGLQEWKELIFMHLCALNVKEIVILLQLFQIFLIQFKVLNMDIFGLMLNNAVDAGALIWKAIANTLLLQPKLPQQPNSILESIQVKENGVTLLETVTL